MGLIRVTNEDLSPLIGVDIEAYDPITGRVLAIATTDASGTATFPTQPDGTQYRPRATRRSGTAGNFPFSGAIHLDNRDAGGVPAGDDSDDFHLPSWFILLDKGSDRHMVEVFAGTDKLELKFIGLPQTDPGNGLVWLSDT